MIQGIKEQFREIHKTHDIDTRGPIQKKWWRPLKKSASLIWRLHFYP